MIVSVRHVAGKITGARNPTNSPSHQQPNAKTRPPTIQTHTIGQISNQQPYDNLPLTTTIRASTFVTALRYSTWRQVSLFSYRRVRLRFAEAGYWGPWLFFWEGRWNINKILGFAIYGGRREIERGDFIYLRGKWLTIGMYSERV